MLATVFIFNPAVAIIGGLIFGTLSYLRASAFVNRYRGQRPWCGPVPWAVIGFFFGLLGFLVCLLACGTSSRRANNALQSQGGWGNAGSDPPYPSVPYGDASGADAGATTALAGWHPDPSGRHELRYWSGTEWTDQVSDHGVPSTDPAV